MKFLTLSILAASAHEIAPTAVFHGFGDACENSGMQRFTKLIADGTGTVAKCFGAPSQVTGNFQQYAEDSCQQILADPDFDGEFNTVGLSQGSLFARYMAENCGKVRNMATLGGPHMGTTTVPHCTSGFICGALNAVVDRLVYLGIVQSHVAPAGYFRDTKHWDRYLAGSTFLPALNNERPDDKDAADRKKNFESINGALLVMFSEDTMIHPKETAWFADTDKDGNVIPMKETELYTKDLIGLKTLDE